MGWSGGLQGESMSQGGSGALAGHGGSGALAGHGGALPTCVVLTCPPPTARECEDRERLPEAVVLEPCERWDGDPDAVLLGRGGVAAVLEGAEESPPSAVDRAVHRALAFSVSYSSMEATLVFWPCQQPGPGPVCLDEDSDLSGMLSRPAWYACNRHRVQSIKGLRWQSLSFQC
ncbi:hypothetical protein DPX16_23614 [Anabarilius grahami]|uniref:Uncharacterized protein n=1 Tax=Anabarilius grahami TaxID=495550 RepID=A0A3N0ZAZ0_ANAGA|nr:hypothetical protein DPX16_23614 [Anabarilius grahami]